MQTSNGKTVMVQGRLVWISGQTVFEGKGRTVFGTQTPIIDTITGLQEREYGFGLAIPKTAFSQPGGALELWNAIHEETYQIYPTRQIPPDYAWKYKDGDTGIDHNGASFSLREGYPGHIVFQCTTRIPIKFFKWENGQNIMIKDGIKCGDYVNVQLQVKAHGKVGQGKPGLYVNPLAVQFLGFGKEIVNQASGDQIFGTGTPAMPEGASATPFAPAGQILPTPVPGQVGQPSYAPPHQAQPTPHYGVMPQQFQPPPGGQPTPMGNAQGHAGYPAPGAGATPSGVPMPQSTATNANPTTAATGMPSVPPMGTPLNNGQPGFTSPPFPR
jgi:hypothetical protein